METLESQPKAGLSGDGLRTWGLIALATGAIGKGLIQQKLLGLGSLDAAGLLSLMDSSDSAMALVTVALILQAVECCAVPIFAFLLAEGAGHSQSLGRYLFRVLAVAVAAEIPYDLVTTGSALSLSAQNPAFGLVLALVVLYFCQSHCGPGLKNRAVQIAVTLAAMVWAPMLRVTYGGCTVVLAVVCWALRKKPMLRNLAGACTAVACSLSSPFFLASPMSYLMIHSYNGTQGEAGKWVRYLAYPVVLLLVWSVTAFMP